MKDIAEKALLYDLWDCVAKMDTVYDFDNTLTADQMIDELSEIVNLELLKLNK